MKIAQVPAALIFVLALASSAMADTLVLNNGDRISGTFESADAKAITFKTDYAAEIKVNWSEVKEVTTDKPMFVEAKNQNQLNGTLTLENSNVVVHTTTAGEVNVPVANVTAVRSEEAQAAYEKSLHPGPLAAWTGGASVGFALARGNSDTTNLAAGFNADRKTHDDEIKAYVTSVYSTTGAIAGGTVTANAILGGMRYDRDLTSRLFAFVGADFTHDALQSLDLQQIYSAGLGWHVIKHPTTTFDVLAGANYTRDSFSGPTATSASTTVNQSFPALTLGEDFAKKIGSASSITEDFTYYPDLQAFSEYRYAADAGWSTQIKKWLGFQVAFSDRYISNPPILGTKKNDVLFSMGLKFSFATK